MQCVADAVAFSRQRVKGLDPSQSAIPILDCLFNHLDEAVDDLALGAGMDVNMGGGTHYHWLWMSVNSGFRTRRLKRRRAKKCQSKC